ncbi:DUF4012 domain-containing protein [Candidatus Curtissbacteria bacterium]|nr:DUF4012 domain-containing protein [Candidatus Curtissbacteria bacterium]
MLKFSTNYQSHNSHVYRNKQKKRSLKKIIIILGIFVIFGLYIGIPAFAIGSSLKNAKNNLSASVASLRSGNLPETKSKLESAKGDLQKAQAASLVYKPLTFIPLIGSYPSDLEHALSAGVQGVEAGLIITKSIEPYADLLGLGSGDFLGGTAQDRMQKAIQTLSKITPELDKVNEKLSKANKEMAQINANRYPDFIPGKPRTNINLAKSYLVQGEKVLTETKPLLEVLPSIMGDDRAKKYMVLFLNDKELRPGGGFITAYAYLNIDKALVKAEGSDNIYDLDDTITDKPSAPEAIIKYLPLVDSFNLRDSNLSPDLPTSLTAFEDLYKLSPQYQPVDGYFTVNTRALSDVLSVLGPIEIEGVKYTNDIVPACDCPQIVYSLLESSGQPRGFIVEERKALIGVLMNAIMDKSLSANKDTLPKLIELGLKLLAQKDVMLNFKDEKTQVASEKLGYAGKIKQSESDYLSVVDSNFAGAKSNLYIQQTVTQDIRTDGDKIIKKVTVNLKNPRAADNCSLERTAGLCLNGIYRDWIRVFVPIGSKLISSTGSETDVVTYDDLGKTVFEGFFTLRPLGTSQIEVEYELPFKASGDYKILIQKQSGKGIVPHVINIDGKKKESFDLSGDQEIKLDI